MDALLAALQRGRAGARARATGVATLGVVAAIAGAAVLHRREAAQEIAACVATGAELDDLWSAGPRTRLQETLQASDVVGAAATAEHVLPWLDRHADAWRAARAEVCLAHVHDRWSADIQSRALWCLDDRRVELAELLRTLERPRPQALHEAVPAAAGLRDPASCLDEGALRRQPALPLHEQAAVREVQAELSRASAQALAGAHADALARVSAALLRADALAWPPLRAAARLREGALATTTGDYTAAEQAQRAAYLTAARADAWEIAADAAIALVATVGYRLARYAEAPVWSDLAELAIERAGDPGRLREAERIENLALVDLDRGDYPTARAGLDRALALRRDALGEEHPRTATTLNRLGAIHLNTGDYPAARALFARSRAIRERVLGPDHPQLAPVLNNLGTIANRLGDQAGAQALFAQALAIEERALGPDHPNVALDLQNLASAYNDEGRPSAALPLYERALALQERALGPDHPLVAITLSNLAIARWELGELAAARPLVERALTIQEQALSPDHPELASTLHVLAKVSFKTGDIAEATAAIERSLAISERSGGLDHPEVAQALVTLAEIELAQARPRDAIPRLERAVAILDPSPGVQAGEAEAHFLLAKALLRGDHARAVAEARRARELCAPTDRPEVDAWLAEHDR